MDTRMIATATTVVALSAIGICRAARDPNEPACTMPVGTSQSACPQQQIEPNDPVEAILNQLHGKTSELKSYEGMVEYKRIQPVLESESLRKGVLYFAKFGEKTRLRINFATLRHDDEKEQKYVEQFIFDGTWLTQIDYQIKAAKRYQLAEPNEPTDAFDLVSRNLPVVGFSKIQDLKKNFEIEMVEPQEDKGDDLTHLHLTVKPGSVHEDDYVYVDFWIDRKLGLPARVLALSTEEDIYEIRLLQPKVNRKIDAKVFDFEIPKGFGEPEIVPLKKKGKQAD